ncbi:MAG: glutathione S-transferase, partial [Novosphingobium sp.]
VVAELVRIAAAVYAPFLAANAAAAEVGAETFRMEAMGLPYEQGVFKYQLKCLADLRNRYAALDAGARGAVDPLLGEGWLALLRG